MSNVSLYRRMIAYLLVYWPLLLLSILISFLVVNFEALSVWFGASLIQTLFNPDQAHMTRPEMSVSNLNEILKYYTYRFVQRSDPFDSLKFVCLLMASTFLLKNLFIYLKALVVARLKLNIVRDMRNQLYNHALKLPVSHYDRTRSGDIISLIVNDIATVNEAMTGTFDKLFVEPLRVIVFTATLFMINVKLTLAVLIIFPTIGFLTTMIGKSVRRRSRRVLEHQAGLQSILHETVSGIRAVKMFNMHEHEYGKFRKENQNFVHHSFHSISLGSISSPLTEVLGVVVVIILLWYGGQQVLSSGGFSSEDFVRFLLFLFVTFTPLKALSNIHNTLQRGFAAAERVFSVLDTAVENLARKKSFIVPEFKSEISFNNIDFTYPGTAEQVLRNVNFTIKKGSIVALVGSSGAGKSTILDLVPRFYDVNSGTITIDGEDIRSMDLLQLRQLFGIVSQETFLFNETIFNNIAYGTDGATREMVIHAANVANAWEFIEKLPDELNTVIGERGVMLSGGQRQRLSIARAILRNPPVLILDEATSALDTESELLVQRAINNLMENRTVLVVAHRLSTIRHADTIIVLEKGLIVEQGSHDELLTLNNRYKYFFDIQFAAKKV
ncbi:MAG: ABC transporter ATP-binding protein [Chitinispirillaceae bacterium]|nr:ABC transporter ATP-binding protein [Chitinispirillaceae bacterium]